MDNTKNTLKILGDLKNQNNLPDEVADMVTEAFHGVNEMQKEKEKAEKKLKTVQKKKEQAFILFQLDLFKRTNPKSRDSVN